MVFDYTPLENETHESFWTFNIPQHQISAPFLLVGHVSEPRVSFDRPSVQFGKVLLGARSRNSIKLVNDEHLPFKFALDKNSYEASDEVLRITGKLLK